MTTIPFAVQAPPTVNENIGDVVRPPQGMVLHIAQGTYSGTIGWEHNPVAQVSSYCVVAKTGEITQVVDLDNRAWTESGGNANWIGVEFEGFVPDALTAAQITSAARLLAWLHTHYGVPIQITDDPVNGHGLGYHSMGGLSWGGHFECPGPAIVAQRPEIIQRALAMVTPTPRPTPPPAPITTTFNEDTMQQDDFTRTLDINGNGYFDVPGVSDAGCHFAWVIGLQDPEHHGYPKVPNTYLTLGETTKVDRVVIVGGSPFSAVTVRVSHS